MLTAQADAEQEWSLNPQRIDDIPLLCEHIWRMGIPEFLDNFMKTHENWSGLSLGSVVGVGCVHILSKSFWRSHLAQRKHYALCARIKEKRVAGNKSVTWRLM